MKTASFFLIIWASLVGYVLAQEPNVKPVSDLPKSVNVQAGTLSLFVDWDPAKDGSFRVFVANRSKQIEVLDYAYGQPRFFLEAKSEQGKWERATVHIDDMCGTGLGIFKLKPDTFVEGSFGIVGKQEAGLERQRIESEIQKKKDFMRTARMTQEAYKAMIAEIDALDNALTELKNRWRLREVRIRVCGENINGFSNSTQMEVDLQAIENAKRDNKAIRDSSLQRLEAIILGTEIFKPIEQPLQVDPVHTAIYAIGQKGHSVKEARAVLERVIAKSENEQTVALAKQRLTYEPFK